MRGSSRESVGSQVSICCGPFSLDLQRVFGFAQVQKGQVDNVLIVCDPSFTPHSNLGLTQLSSHVGELARFVELKPKSRSSRDPSASSFSPAAAAAGPGSRPQTPRTVSSTLLPPAASSPSLNGAGAGGLQENQVPSGATGLVVTPLASFQAREFGRISSAPAAVAGVSSPSSSALLQLQMQTQTQQRTPLGASSSGAGARGGNLLPSHSHSHSPIVGGIDDPRTTYARTSSRGFEPPGSPVLPEDYQHPSQPRPTPTTTLKARSPFGALGTAGGGGAPRRPMDRTSSLAPPPTPGGSIIATSSPKGSDREGWRRTPSGTYVNPKKDSWSGDGSGDLEVSMANNQLTRCVHGNHRSNDFDPGALTHAHTRP